MWPFTESKVVRRRLLCWIAVELEYPAQMSMTWTVNGQSLLLWNTRRCYLPVLSKVGVYTSRLITQMVNNRHRHAHKPLITLLVWWAFLYNPWGFYNWNNNQPRSESQRWPNARWIQYQLADNRYIHQDESHNGKAQSYTEENIGYPDLFNSQRD